MIKVTCFVVFGIFLSTYVSWNDLVTFVSHTYHHPLTQALIAYVCG